MPKRVDVEALLHEVERQSREGRARTRQIIMDADRPDVLADFDQKMKDIDSGVEGARMCWHSISDAQRRVLQIMGAGRSLFRSTDNPKMYDACGRGCVLNACRLPTARNLSARELIHVAGGALDPEASFVLTERGRFVLRWGPIND